MTLPFARWLAAAVSLCLALSAAAADHPLKPTGPGKAWYVSPQGSDENDGLSPERPARTVAMIDRLLEKMGPQQAGGSVIYLMPGVYSENTGPFHCLSIRADGRAGFPITITSFDPARRAVIDGKGDTEKGVVGGCAMALDIAAFVVVADLEIRNGSTGLAANSCSDCVFERLEVHGIRGEGGRNPAGIKLIANPYRLTIRNCLVYDVQSSDGKNPQNAMGIGIFGGNGNVIHNCEVRDCGAGIRYKHHSTRQRPTDEFRTLIFRNLVHRFRTGGIIAATDNAHVFENLVHTGGTGFFTDCGDGAPYLSNRFYHNTVWAVGTGFYSDPNVESRDSVFRDNIVGAEGPMIYVKGWETIKACDWNLYAADRFRTPSGNPAALAELRQKGHDARSLVGDPGFVNPGADFRLAAHSPARGKASEGHDLGAWRSAAAAEYAIGLLRDARPGGDITPPDVRLTSPLEGAAVSGPSVNLEAAAADDVGVVAVQFMAGTQKIGDERTAAPYTAAWDVSRLAPGPYALTAVARDKAGNVMTSMAVIVTVTRPAAP